MNPEEVLEMVSQYQTKLVAAIFASVCNVYKFIRDAVCATFGNLTSRGNDAQNTFERSSMTQVSMRQSAKERGEKNLNAISHKKCIHFRRSVIGDVGSDERHVKKWSIS